MIEKYGTAAWAVCAAWTLFGSVGIAEGQTIRGLVVDAVSARGVTDALIVIEKDQRAVLTVRSDSLGSFVVRLSEPGIFVVRAERIGYVQANPAEIQIGEGGEVGIRIELDPNAFPLDEVVATGLRRGRLPAAATVQGLHERRSVLPRVGPSRVFVHDDPEMQSAATVGHLLERWIAYGGERRCVDWFVNGFPMDSLSQPREFVRELPTAALEGIEYYRDHLTAPLEYQAKGSCIAASIYSIIAVWFKR